MFKDNQPSSNTTDDKKTNSDSSKGPVSINVAFNRMNKDEQKPESLPQNHHKATAHQTLGPRPIPKIATKETTDRFNPTIASKQKSEQPTNAKKTRTKSTTKKVLPFSKKNLTYAVCGLIVIVAVGVLTWTLISRLNRGVSEETTFASNDNQTTITIEPTDTGSNSNISHTRTVYEYDGDNVVGMKTYFEYADNEAAKSAYESLKDQPEFKGAEVVDKYIIVTADPSQFKGLTADDIRQQAEAIEQFQKSRKKPENTESAPASTEEATAPESEPGPEE